MMQVPPLHGSSFAGSTSDMNRMDLMAGSPRHRMPASGAEMRYIAVFDIGARSWSWESFLDIHLDPLGGLSGDMFVAALLDAFPEHWPHVQSTIASLQLGEEGECKLAPLSRSFLRSGVDFLLDRIGRRRTFGGLATGR